MAVYLSVLVIVDGLVSRNPSAWANLPRALVTLSIVAVAILYLYRAGERMDVVAACLAGIVAAMVVSESYRAILAGISLWVIYLGAYVTARSVTRDWPADVALAGMIVAVFAFVLLPSPPPSQMWNRNVLGAALVVCLAASFYKLNLPQSLVILAGILATGSRGAMLGAFVAGGVMFYRRALVAAPALAGALFIVRPVTAGQRFELWLHGAQAFMHNLAFGSGPGLLVFPYLYDGRVIMQHSHNTLLGLAAQVGLVGLVVLAAFIALGRSQNIPRAGLAAVAGVAVNSIVDDPLIALPVGVMLVLTVTRRAD